MSRPIFRQSAETASIVEFMRRMPKGKVFSPADLQRAVGPYAPASYYSARNIVLKEGITIGTEKGVGFFRQTGGETVQSLASDLRSIRKKSVKVMTKCENALRDNLSSDDQFRAMRVQTAAGIIHSNASMPTSNARRQPDEAVHQSLLPRRKREKA